MKLPGPRSYPKELHIAEETWQVRLVKKIPDEGADTVGRTDFPDRIIWIKRDQTKQQLFRTFIHEVIHCIEFEHNLDIKHRDVYTLEKALVDTLMMNI